MTNQTLATSYVRKAEKRLKALAVLLQEDAFSDVIREAQEIVELCLKAALRIAGVDPPKIHDVGSLLATYEARFPPSFTERIPRLVRMRIRAPDNALVAEMVMRIELSEEAGCLENSFQRVCRPRKPA